MTRPVRTRFAPSPTGPLHIGGARSALFSWLLARHYGGQFILRIEDTDQGRYVEGALDLIKDGLRWLGLEWDEGPDKDGPYGPYTQSERLPLYQEWAQWLINNGKAYRAYETPEELEQINAERQAQKLPPGYDGRGRDLTPEQEAAYIAEGRKPVVRFKALQTGKTVVHDLVRDEVEFDNSTVADTVLLKSDGFPTYHLAHVIDDHFMEISHVTRSIEWLPSVALHVQLWHAFGWEMPAYVHLPVLLNPNGKGKLSKRHAGFSEDGKRVLVLTKEFEDAGYYGPAVVNFLTNIGWNIGNNREVFTVEEAIARFDGTNINPANSAYPIEKLDWLNGVYIREHMSPEDLAQHLRPFLERAGYVVETERLAQVTPLVQSRIKTFDEVVGLAGFLFAAPQSFTPPSPDQLIQKKMDTASTISLLEASISALHGVEPFEHEALHERFVGLAEELEVKNGPLFGTLRVAITGQSISTPTFETMAILGREETIRRIQLAIGVLA